MSYELFAITKNGKPVYFDSIGSHAATHITDTPELEKLVRQAVADRVVEAEEEVFEVDFGRPVGTTDLIETTENDDIVYAKRLNRDIYTRFARNREPVPTSWITIVLKWSNERYELWSAWVGRLTPAFPGDERTTVESKDYWARHALAWGRQPIQPGTETKDCPW